MKLLAVVVFGYLAIGSEASYHHHSHGHHDDTVQRNINDPQQKNFYGSNQYLGQESIESMDQRYINNEKIFNDMTMLSANQQYNSRGQYNQYSEYGWYGPSRPVSNDDYQYKQQYNGRDYSHITKPLNQEDGQGLYQQQQQQRYADNDNLYYGLYSDFDTEYFGLNTLEDYTKEQHDGDIAKEIGRKVALKMAKFYDIFEKHTARNGTVQTGQVQEPLPLRQWALPMTHHQFINMVDGKVYGLSRGMIKALYADTERNTFDFEYLFNYLLAKGSLKASVGPKGLFNIKFTDTNVNVSTDLGSVNRNRYYGRTFNGDVEFGYQNVQDAAEAQSIGDNVESKYVQFINRAIESEMIDNSYGGLVGCLRSEIESTFDMPAYMKSADMVIENTKSQLTVSLVNTQTWKSNDSPSFGAATDRQKKIRFVGFRQSKYGNGGYKLKVSVVLAKQPTWQCDVVAQKPGKRIVVENVNFRAQSIVATAVMERVPQPNGMYKFHVNDASVKLDGLRYDIGKFDVTDSTNEKFAKEVGQNLSEILENGMSAALLQQLYHQQRMCQQNQIDCVKCNRFNDSL